MKRLSICLFCLLLTVGACSTRSTTTPIRDLTDLPQDAGAFHGLNSETPLLSPQQQKTAFTHFLAEHFGPWERSQPTHTADEVFWGLARYENRTAYGENTLPLDAKWIDRMREDSRVEQYPSLHLRAIAVTNTSMRVLPTHRPVFDDFNKPGEGFPFDYMQNSLVLAGTPLLATHVSADRAWILVESRFAFGWVPVRDIGWVDDGFISIFKTGTYAAITRDDVPVADGDGNHRFTAHIGTLLPIMRTGTEGSDTALLIPARSRRGDAVAQVAFLPEKVLSPAPIPATPSNFTRLINAMLNRPYGWGGLYEGRDCSAAIMDLMAAFGIYLPRNSSQQIAVGTLTKLDGLSRENKKKAILAQSTPFLTLVRKPGHIMLYIGQHNGQPVIFHATWGLKTKTRKGYGRKIIGRAVITTLEPGKELPDLARPGGILLETTSAISTLP